MQAPLPRIKLRLEYGHALTLGPGKMQLLVLIDHHGSIAAAGRDMGMSYKRAWSLVEEMNAGFNLPVVDSSRGGPGGGGAVLTQTGHAVIRHFRALETLLDQAGARDLRALGRLLADRD